MFHNDTFLGYVRVVVGSMLMITWTWLILLGPRPTLMKPFVGVDAPIRAAASTPALTPAQVKAAYKLRSAGAGSGTIALIDAYDDPTIESDLATFDKKFGLKTCTTNNGCFEKHVMSTSVRASADWSGETSLDVEWAHAIAPGAKILLVEATTASRTNLLKAVDYARARADVVAVSMSWGGDEFATEAKDESHFVSASGASFFASSGDEGHGVSWPAASANVIAVGGSTLNVNASGTVSSETAWDGSGGGVSVYIPLPSYQSGIKSARRALPDVAYDADPNTGYAVYDSSGSNGWVVVGGTSAGVPQWAALRAIDHNLTLARIYAAKTGIFHDITKGSNGSCATYCQAKTGYDFVTGLGSPLGAQF